jgi:hypothetical protein
MNKLRSLVHEKFPDLDVDSVGDRVKIANELNEIAKDLGINLQVTGYIIRLRLKTEDENPKYRAMEANELLLWSSLLNADPIYLLVKCQCGTERITVDVANKLGTETGAQLAIQDLAA